ncbi:disease resistance protein RPM1-like [Hevea brasiliensis]|uniref:disease resistance protein RPM1-like n=1 Tax=Hevea brasiliensis TaxID=3981 RepID=UPI0025CE6968|nr:disease resistance protein RPM1-like [Hevea brasiliensis]
MPLFLHFYSTDLYFYGEMPSGTRATTEAHVIPSSRAQQDEDKGQTSSLAAFKSNYEKLPHYLKSCLDYCYVVSKEFYMSIMKKGNIVRLLLAQGLIPEKPGEIMEDTAENIINELIGLEMLHERYLFSVRIIEFSEFYEKSCLLAVTNEDFVSKAATSPIHACMFRQDLPPYFKSFLIRSLIIEFYSPLQTLCGFQFLLVLILIGSIEYLPDEVGDLVHLKYLYLACYKMKTFPRTIGNLQKLQTLHLSNCSKLFPVPVEIYNIKQLRHLLFVDYYIDTDGIRVPRGIGTLANLHTCTGVYAGAGIASELSSLTQLRKLDVEVSDDHAGELFASIIKLENLVSLSLAAEENWSVTPLPELEQFSPPPHLQELILRGVLFEMPNWLPSVENLTILELWHSNLLEEPSSVLQYLPKLKHLTLWEAYKAKLIGKEFCDVGGFPELETLIITSTNLVEWTEIVNGAFPSLRYLRFDYCDKLRFLPEGLQNISTVQELYVTYLHGDLARRLNGEENYKIKHISKFHWSSEIF